MTSNQIKELLHATPFTPFRVHVADQKEFEIPHPDFAMLTQNGQTLVVNAKTGDFVHIISVPLISRIETKEAQSA
jgi:hypothetical protein